MKSTKTKRAVSPARRLELFRSLKARFEQNMNRHHGVAWTSVQAKLEANPEKLWSISEMESTDGEPDVIGHDLKIHFRRLFTGKPQGPHQSLLRPRSAGFPQRT
jgi:hypothetical protein